MQDIGWLSVRFHWLLYEFLIMEYVYAACKTNVHAELSKVVMQGKTCIMNTAVEQLQRPRTCHAVQISIQRLHMECGMHAVMGSAYLPPHLNNRKEYIQREREREGGPNMQNAMSANGSRSNSHACLRHS